ncbi:hypothetical protein EFW17_01555 [Halostreptopolyspora alba]|uniref:Uncharacterized protein n=2 Tax=Halostreptopolyspora alba TaxID=2487137 RepID=A0A3N0EI05_9ACTN|nr:hypothetical protein EFW17_01555 [Nocardiopsaceae bacterium YIM 96095]
MRAAELLEQGQSQVEVARMGEPRPRACGVEAPHREGGTAALRRCVASGRPPKLAESQVERVRAGLEAGARAHGFDSELWTLERVGRVVEWTTGVALA